MAKLTREKAKIMLKEGARGVKDIVIGSSLKARALAKLLASFPVAFSTTGKTKSGRRIGIGAGLAERAAKSIERDLSEGGKKIKRGFRGF